MFPVGSNNESTGPDNSDTLRADLDLLNQEDAPPPENEETPEDGKEGEEGKEEEDVEEEEVEKPEKEEEEEKEPEKVEDKELVTRPRPTVKEINSKYPNFFKDFPDMRHMLFREGEYTKLFPTVDDAKEASDNSESFEHFQDLLQSGTPESFNEFLKGINEAGSLKTMAANFLPSLYSNNRDMYFQVTQPIAESLVRNAYKTAKQNGNENLANAALVVSLWAFGDKDFATGDKRSAPIEVKPEAKDENLEKEKKDFYQVKYNDARQFVTSTSQTRLRAEIKKGLDPNGVFNEFTSNLLTKQIVDEIGSALEADERHMSNMNSLWKHAHKAGFAGNWKDRILSTYLSRARTVMPAIRARIRTSALEEARSRATQREEKAEKSGNRREVQGSQSSNRSTSKRPPSAREVDWNKTSDLDLLNDRVTLRKG